MIRPEKATGSTQVKATFALPVGDPAGPVAVAGDFNGWDPAGDGYERNGFGGDNCIVDLTGAV